MKVIVVEPQEDARIAQIGDKLEDIQAVVGKPFEIFFPYHKPIALAYNADGIKLGLEPSFAFCDDRGYIYKIICGTFIIVGVSDPGLEGTVACHDDDIPYTDGMFKSVQDKYIEGLLKDFTVPHGNLEVTDCTLGEREFIHAIERDSFNTCLITEVR